MISQNTIDQVRNLSIVDVVRYYIDLQKAGSNYISRSPFNDEKTPSFYVVPSKNIFKCFSSGYGGDAIRFVMLKGKLSFQEAVHDICKQFSIPIEYNTHHTKQYYDELELLYNVTEQCAKHYAKELGKLDATHDSYKELVSKRKFSRDTIIQWQLGYAPGDVAKYDPTGWSFLTRQIESENNINSGLELGLVKFKSDVYFDTFRNRIIFPFVDHRGRHVGFGARSLQPDQYNAKYLNSSESRIFNKSKILYGLHFAIPAIRERGYVIIVEGYTDVISLHQASFENTVGICGTALTEDHCRLLKKYTSHAKLFYDSDDAGHRATMKAIDKLFGVGIQPSVIAIHNNTGAEKVDPDELVRMFSMQNC